MPLEKKYHDVVRLIAEEKIIDITSFIEYKYKKYVLSEDKIVAAKKADYDKGKNKIEEYLSTFKGKTVISMSDSRIKKERFTPEKEKEMENVLNSYKLNDDSFLYKNNYRMDNKVINFLEEEVYIIDDETYIDDFIYIWKLLKSKSLIMIESRNRQSADINHFFKLKNFEEKKEASRIQNLSDYIKRNSLSDARYIPFNKRYIYKEKDIHYSGKELELSSLFSSHQDYQKNKITVTHELKDFVDRGFKTIEEKAFLNQKRYTWIAIGVSILVSIASIVFGSINYTRNNKFWRANEVEEAKATSVQEEILGSIFEKIEEGNITSSDIENAINNLNETISENK